MPWVDQLAATQAFLLGLRPWLLDHGLGLDLKTHEEISTPEVVQMVEAVGPDVLGIGLDQVNVLVRLEDPLAAARRTAPYVRRVFLSDADLFFVDHGVERKLRPLGDGIVDWPGTLAILKAAGAAPSFTVELHRGQFSMPIFDAAWMASEPAISPLELAEVVRLTTVSEGRLAEPGRPSRDAYQADVLERLPATLAYLPPLRAAWDNAPAVSPFPRARGKGLGVRGLLSGGAGMKTRITGRFVIGYEGGDHVVYRDGEVVYEDDRVVFVGHGYPGSGRS